MYTVKVTMSQSSMVTSELQVVVQLQSLLDMIKTVDNVDLFPRL